MHFRFTRTVFKAILYFPPFYMLSILSIFNTNILEFLLIKVGITGLRIYFENSGKYFGFRLKFLLHFLKRHFLHVFLDKLCLSVSFASTDNRLNIWSFNLYYFNIIFSILFNKYSSLLSFELFV